MTTTTLDPNVETLNEAKVLLALAAQSETAASSGQSAIRNGAPGGSTPQGAVVSVHSDAWWHAISICEQGGRNDPYFGYFSVMDGSTGGGKSWAEQLVIVNGIIARHGDYAWAAKCVHEAYAASPGG